MAYSIHPFTSEFVDQVKDFNRRLEAGGVSYRSTEEPMVKNFEHGDVAIRSENFVVRDDAVDQVCGSYTLVHYPFAVRGVPANFAYIQIPLSEGTVNPKYGAVGALILRDILRRYPVTFGLGMGGIDNPLPRALKAMRFQL